MLNRFFKILGSLFTKSTASTNETEIKKSQSPEQVINKEDNLKSSKSNISSIINREAILNKNQKVAGYYFSLSRSVQARLNKSTELTQSLYEDALLESIIRMDINRLQGQRLVFIPILLVSLERPTLEKLPKKGVVIIISELDALVNQASKYLPLLISLKKSGFELGLKANALQLNLKPFVDLCDYIFIDVSAHDLPNLKSKIDTINKLTTHKNLVATNIKLLDEFYACTKLPLQYFQGSFVTHREMWANPAIDTGRMRILNLLNLLRKDAENTALINAFKQDPTLSFKLLRSVNSVGVGLINKVNSIDQALIVMGRQQLYRWLCLLLFTSTNENALDLALMENALVRARLAELCAKNSMSKLECEEIFMTGIFSLLDVLLKLPMETLLKQVNLPKHVEQALIEKTGPYAPYLALSMACETLEQESVETLSNQIGVDLDQISLYQTEAILWAQTVNQ